MTWRVIGIALGAVIYVVVLIGALGGSPQLAALLVTATVLVVGIAGGNWLQHWLGIRRRPPQFAQRDRSSDPDEARDPEGPA